MVSKGIYTVVASAIFAHRVFASAPCAPTPSGKMLCCPPDDAECLAKIQETRSEPEVSPPALVEPSRPEMFGAVQTFAKSRLWDGSEAFDVAVVGLPFGLKAGYDAPGLQAVRRASCTIAPYSRTYNRAISEINLVDAQDILVSGKDRMKALQKSATKLFKSGKPVVALSGDQSTSIPLLTAAKSVLGEFAIIHIDKDLEVGNGSHENDMKSSTAMFWAAAKSLVDTRHSLHVGVRGNLASNKITLLDAELGFATVGAEEFAMNGVHGVVQKIKKRLARRDGSYMPAYISVDLDVLDPLYFPNNGGAGGITVNELRAVLAGLQDFCYIVGGDVRHIAGLVQPSSVQIAASIAADMVLLAGGRQMGHEVVPPNLKKPEL